MYPGYSVGAHEECSTDYHFVKHPLEFLGLGQSRSPQFLYANETRRERMAAWRINKEIATSNIPALLTLQASMTHAERQDVWVQIACPLAYDTKESLGSPSDPPTRGGWSQSSEGCLRRSNPRWAHISHVETCEAFTTIPLSLAQASSFFSKVLRVDGNFRPSPCAPAGSYRDQPGDSPGPSRIRIAVEALFKLSKPDCLQQCNVQTWKQALASLAIH